MVKEPPAWIASACRELDQLLASGETSLMDADAWRALALTARLSLATSGALGPRKLDRARVDAWLRACAPPDPIELCDALGEALAGADPPEGAALDLLLDIEDRAGVYALCGAETAAKELVADAAATLSVYPERAAPLGGFARSRLSGVAPSAPTRALWEAVERATAEAAASTQPLAGPPPAAMIALRERLAGAPGDVIELAPRRARRLRLPAPVALAAATAGADERSLGATEEGVEGWLYEEGGALQVELALPDGAREVRALSLLASEAGAEVARARLEVRREGRGVFASLGPAFGAAGALRSLASQQGRDPATLEWWIEVEHGEG